MELILSPLIRLYDWFFAYFFNVTASYGFSIILLSLFVSTLMLPLFWLGERILERGAEQKQKMQAKLDSLQDVPRGLERYYYSRRIYRIYGYHPVRSLGNVLGLLIQIPFFLAAYFYLSHNPALEGVSFFMLRDLSQADSLFGSLNVLPFLMTLCNILASESYLLAHGRQNQRSSRVQQYMIAALFFVLLYPLASGLLLYWTCNNVYALAKNMIECRYKKIKFIHGNIINTSKIVLFLLFLSPFLIIRHTNYAFILLCIIFIFLIIMQYKEIISLYKKKLSDISLYQIIINILFLILAYSVLAFFISSLMKQMVNPIIVLPVFINHITTLAILLLVGNIILYSNIFKKDFAFRLLLQLRNSINNLHVLNNLYAFVFLTFLLQIFLYTPVILILTSPIELGIKKSTFFYILFIVVLFLLISVYIKNKKYKLSNKFVNITFLFLLFATLVNFTYGYLLQLDLGIIRGLKFVNEGPLVRLPSGLQIIEIYLLFAILILIICMGIYIQKYTKYICILINVILIINIYTIFTDNLKEINKATTSLFKKTPNNSEKNHLKNINNYFIKNNLYNFSKNSNILVIIFDAFPSNMLQDILNENPSIHKSLPGFIWYRNNVSTGNFTRNSLNAMIAGPNFTLSKINKNNDRTLIDLIDHNWANLFNNARKSGYSASGNAVHSSKNFSNYIEVPVSLYADGLPSLTNYAKGASWQFVANLTLFKISPLVMKKLIYSYGSWAIPFDKVDDPYNHYSEYTILKNFAENIRFSSPIPTFKYFWFSMNVAPFLINEKGRFISVQDLKRGFNQYSDLSRKYTAKYLIGIIAQLAESFKANGIYDNTKIIVASDHGSAQSDWNDKALYSLMLTKDFNAKHDFQVSNIPTSNADIPAMIGTGIDPSGEFNRKHSYGKDYTKEPDMQRVLKYHVTLHGNTAAFHRMTKYPSGTMISIQGDPYIKENWEYGEFK